jgi:FKBP-type peptidyl-prolyl cis-trans isomerase
MMSSFGISTTFSRPRPHARDSTLRISLLGLVLLLLQQACCCFAFNVIAPNSACLTSTNRRSKTSPQSTEPSFRLRPSRRRRIGLQARADSDNDTPDDMISSDPHLLVDRRKMLKRSVSVPIAAVAAAAATVAAGMPSSAAVAAAETTTLTKNENGDTLVSTDKETGKPIYKTSSGLEYIDLEDGDSGGVKQSNTNNSKVTPRYGQLVGFSYTGYLMLPKDQSGAAKRQKFASSTGFVTKHGNGKLIAGLDEGLHTMHVGSVRRLIIPPKLGFVASGLGPLPELPWQRWKLNSLLGQMIAQRGGRIVYDIKLERILDDEADQGYYEGTYIDR